MFENKAGKLFPNQFVNARLLVEEKSGSGAFADRGDPAQYQLDLRVAGASRTIA